MDRKTNSIFVHHGVVGSTQQRYKTTCLQLYKNKNNGQIIEGIETQNSRTKTQERLIIKKTHSKILRRKCFYFVQELILGFIFHELLLLILHNISD